MNDFSELEKELKALRPAPLRETFIARVEQAMSEPPATDDSADNIIRPVRFRSSWAIGLSLAAAAAVVLLLRVNFRAPDTTKRVASASPAPTQTEPPRLANRATAASTSETSVPLNTFIPAQTTQVIYRKRDEGLLFAQNSDQPLRRVRSVTQESLQWRNPATGASLRVSYPSEQVQLIPVSGQ